MKRFGLCSDHAGFALKEEVKKILTDQGIEYQDFGTYSEERADYPDFAHKLGEAIDSGELEWGIAICGSGNANVLSLPARFVSLDEAKKIIMAFLSTDFEGGRHEARVAKIPLC